jgi:undecaprenyl-diphosphatase
MNLDWTLFQALNSLAGRWPAFDWFIRFLMNDYCLTTALTALLVALWFRSRTSEERRLDQAAVIHTIVAVLLSGIVVKGLNLLFFRIRPFTDHAVNLLYYYPSDSSLPSNSVTVAFCFAIGVLQRSRRLGLAGIGFGALLALSRVIGGVHYPTDVLAGALLGTGLVYLVRRFSWLLEPLVRAVRYLARQLLLA